MAKDINNKLVLTATYLSRFAFEPDCREGVPEDQQSVQRDEADDEGRHLTRQERQKTSDLHGKA
jgi:hypothetical protein